MTSPLMLLPSIDTHLSILRSKALLAHCPNCCASSWKSSQLGNPEFSVVAQLGLPQSPRFQLISLVMLILFAQEWILPTRSPCIILYLLGTASTYNGRRHPRISQELDQHQLRHERFNRSCIGLKFCTAARTRSLRSAYNQALQEYDY